MILNAIHKPIEIEAIKYSGDMKELMDFVGAYLVISNGLPLIMSPTGRLNIAIGDYIVKQEARKEGKFYILKSVDFDSTFDLFDRASVEEKKNPQIKDIEPSIPDAETLAGVRVF